MSRLSALPMVNSSNFSITLYIYGRTRPWTKNHCTLWVRPVRCNIRKGLLHSFQAAFLSLWFFELWFTLPPCMGAIEDDLTKKKFTLVVDLKKKIKAFSIFPDFISIFQTFSRSGKLLASFKTFPRIQNSVQTLRVARLSSIRLTTKLLEFPGLSNLDPTRRTSFHGKHEYNALTPPPPFLLCCVFKNISNRFWRVLVLG